MIRLLRKYLPSILIAVLITWLSLADSNTINPGRLFNFPDSDKIAHFLIYGLFTLILLMDSCSWKIFERIYYIIIVIPVILGVLMEALQYLLTNYRQADFFDFLADLAGIACAALLICIIRKVYKKKVLD
jgi:VanZ family protein